jgi:DNA-binding IclR family transcriptional regulator
VPRRSPPTERVVRVVELLASRPDEGLGAAEVARHLGITRSTCIGILNELVARGWATREAANRSYRLGPSLLWLGRAALVGLGVVDALRPSLAALARRHRVAWTLSRVVGDAIVVLDRVGPVGRFDRWVQPGQQYPYAPPSGVVFAAWLEDQAIDRWLAEHPPVPVDRGRLMQVAHTARRIGCIVERFSEASARSLTLLARLAEHDDDSGLQRAWREVVAIFPDRYYLLDELATLDVLPVTLACAPAYGATGAPELLVGVLVFDTVRRQRLARLLADLLAVACTATNTLGGQDPWAPHVTIEELRTRTPSRRRAMR